MAFDALSLDPKILKALTESGYRTPTEIQKEAIPVVAAGRDLRACAQTGTGKTAAFLLPTLSRLAKEQSLGRGPRLLILSPTRELAMQIADQAAKYSRYMKRMKSVCICGGVPYRVQLKRMAKPFEILIATPGRLIDLLNQKKINLSTIETVVLDEADRMLDMGFLEPVEEIMNQIPGKCQTLLFSATMKGPIMKLSKRLLDDPADVSIEAQTMTHGNIDQRLHYVDDRKHKDRLLNHLLEKMEQTIIFTSTKRHCDQLVRDLKAEGRDSAALHGDMRQNQRSRVIAGMKKGSINILVATDVAARGLDVNSVTHVINYDLPRQAEDYVHRIGRTGRAGAKGEALSFVVGCDRPLLKRIESFTGEQIPVSVVEGFEPRKEPTGSSRSSAKKGRTAPKGRNEQGRTFSKGGASNPRGAKGRTFSKGGAQGRSYSKGGAQGRSYSKGGAQGRTFSKGEASGSRGAEGRTFSKGGASGARKEQGRSYSKGGASGSRGAQGRTYSKEGASSEGARKGRGAKARTSQRGGESQFSSPRGANGRRTGAANRVKFVEPWRKKKSAQPTRQKKRH
ncbi:MAG: ATP-dependent RNA helicase DeaD [Chlamydiales bacterium]|nr:ATP-dependent RNA helicase DeaD [Chlamydiales bacterium]